MADTEGSDTEVSDTEVSDAEVSDAEVSDAEVSDAEVSDAEVSDAEVSDAEVSDTEILPPATPLARPRSEAKPIKSIAESKKPREKPSHPSTSEMVNDAIKTLNERSGSSLQAIKKYVAANYQVDPDKISPFIKRYLKSAVKTGNLTQTKGQGANGSFKIPAAKSKSQKSTAPKAAKSGEKKVKHVTGEKKVKSTTGEKKSKSGSGEKKKSASGEKKAKPASGEKKAKLASVEKKAKPASVEKKAKAASVEKKAKATTVKKTASSSAKDKPTAKADGEKTESVPAKVTKKPGSTKTGKSGTAANKPKVATTVKKATVPKKK